MAQILDLRSDTVTKPTDEMRHAMAHAEVGDDVYGEDPTVNRLEELAAEKLGKEAGLFVTSGTQGNQVAIATHVKTGEEVIAEAESHIFYYEAAAVSAIAGAQIRQVVGRNGVLEAESVRKAIREPNIHHPRTALISIENTHNRAGGTVVNEDQLKSVYEVAQTYGVPIHMDGARLFNAAAALNVEAKSLARWTDTVQICLSKGLCAPVGSVLVGPREFIEHARQWRKRLGGGMRQAGVIAAPGVLALTNMVERLHEDHSNARWLAERLANIPGVRVNLSTVQTNIVIADIAGTGQTVPDFLAALKHAGVLATSFGDTLVRFVTHRDVSRHDMEKAADCISRVVSAAQNV